MDEILMADLPKVTGLPARVKIVEVGPRDGLQAENGEVLTGVKIELVNRLSRSGVCTGEAASFVSPKWVPQMADGAQVMAEIDRHTGVIYSALGPNLRGPWQVFWGDMQKAPPAV